MTPYLLDTNILVEAIRASRTWDRIKARYDPLMADIRPAYCSVTEGELRSLASLFGWGPGRVSEMEYLLGYYRPLAVEEPEIVAAYAEIDFESKMLGKKMGKNDLWIAAATSAHEMTLLTTNRDFDPITPRFIRREWIELAP